MSKAKEIIQAELLMYYQSIREMRSKGVAYRMTIAKIDALEKVLKQIDTEEE